MKKIALLFLYINSLMLIPMSFANAQNNLPLGAYKSITNIKTLIANNYKPDKSFLMDSCINTIIYLKFKVDDEKIDSIDFSIKSPVQIKEALQKAVTTTNKLWKPTKIEIQQLKGKTFLLPIIIYYQLGCTPSTVLTKEVAEKKPLSELFHNPDQALHSAINDMLKFEKGGSYPLLDCILISPLRFAIYD